VNKFSFLLISVFRKDFDPQAPNQGEYIAFSLFREISFEGTLQINITPRFYLWDFLIKYLDR
jgi:hypothetical protein